MVGASAHRVALDNVEVLEVDQWLALLIIGDLDPYTQPVTGPELLPTRSAKSRIVVVSIETRGGQPIDIVLAVEQPHHSAAL